jgi:1-acyl-sn-glycerol-3-phosphate acyltransferase
VAELVYRPVIGVARALFAAQGLRFEVRGTENVPRRGGAVLAMNHIGYMDFTYAGFAALRAGRLVRFMAKEEVFRHPVSGPLMRGMHHIPVDRDAGAGSYRAAVQALRDGEVVGVFPEATISRSFELKEFKAGAARMAAEAQVPLLPTVIWGSQRVWTKDHPRRLGRTRTPISVWVGEPIPVARDDDMAAATEKLRARMEQMLHDAQESYGEQPRPEDTWWLPARLGGTAPTPEEAHRLDREELKARLAAAKAAKAAKAARTTPPEDRPR